MNITRIAILGAAAIAAGAAALIVRGMLGGGTPPTQASLPPPVTTVEVLVAARDVQPGHALEADAVRWIAWPKSAVSGDFITKQNQPDLNKAIAGTVVRSPLVNGQPITDANIVHTNAAGFMAATLTKGTRAVAIPISAETGAGGFVLPNDRVDVIMTKDMSGGSGQKDFQSETILRDIRVLAIDQTIQEPKDQQSSVGKTATLELTPPEAEIIAQSQASGILSLALRSLGDSNGKDTGTASRRARTSVVAVIRYGVMRNGAGSNQERPPQ